MSATVVYRHAILYEAVMAGLYGRYYGARYKALANLIPEGSSVLDLCCGPAILFDRYLRQKRVEYTGLDMSEPFIHRLRARGGNGLVCDLQQNVELPAADYVVMQASLYGFLPDARPIFERMLQAAKRYVVIAEPVRNMTSSRNPIVAAIGRRMTDAGDHRSAHRFTEETLDQFFSPYACCVDRQFLIPGGREKVYVFDKSRLRPELHATLED